MINDSDLKAKRGKLSKLILTVLSTITLGAIGSGVWQIFLSRLATAVGVWALSVIGRMFRGYLDHLYAQVGPESQDAYAFLPFVSIVVFFIGISWVLLIAVLNGRRRHALSLSRSSQSSILDSLGGWVYSTRGVVFVLFACVINTFGYGIAAFETKYARRASLFVERSLDILAPKLSEQERLELRAQYRSVYDAHSYLALYDRIEKVAQERHVDVGVFTPIR